MKIVPREMSLSESFGHDAEIAEAASGEDFREYSALQRMAAGIEQESSLVAFQHWIRDERQTPEPEVDYDPMKEAEDEWVPYLDLLRGSQSHAESQMIMDDVFVEERRKKMLENGGMAGFLGQMIGMFSSPEYWPAMLYTGAAGGITKTAVQLGLIGVTEQAAHELILNRSQLTRDPYESLVNVGTAGVFGGVIGAGVGAVTRRSASKEITDHLSNIAYRDGIQQADEIAEAVPANPKDPSVGQAGGAAAVDENLGEFEAAVRMPRVKSGWVSALRPLMKSRSPVVQKALNKFFGHDNIVGYNEMPIYRIDERTGKPILDADGNPEQIGVEYVAKETSLSRQVDREVMTYQTNALNAINDGFKRFVAHEGRSVAVARMKNRGQFQNFNEQVRWAMSNGDVHENAVVQETAKRLRAEVYAPIEKLAKEAEMLDQKHLLELRRQYQYAENTLRRTKDPAKRARWQEEVNKLEKQLDEFTEISMQVKYARSYANRRWNRANIEASQEEFRRVLHQAYIDQHADEAVELARTGLLDEAKQLQRKGDAAGAAAKTEEANALNREDFMPDDVRKQELLGDVERTYEKIVSGDMNGDVYYSMAEGAPFKERMLPIDDSVLLSNNWLQTDMLDQVKGYTNTTLRAIRMKQAAGDTEMATVLDKVRDDYVRMRRDVEARMEGKSGKELQKLQEEVASIQRERTDVLDALRVVRNRYYGRSAIHKGAVGSVANYARAIRNWNVMRMMGGVLVTSLNDVARLNLAKIYTPEIGRAGPSLLRTAYEVLRNPELREQFRAIGIAHEQASMIRTSRFVDIGEPVMSGSHRSRAFLNASSRGAKYLMKATALAEWTDLMKLTAAALTQNQLVKMMGNYAKLSAKNKAILAEMGVDERLAGEVMEQFNRYGTRHGRYATSLNWDDWDNTLAAEQMQNVLFRQSERILVTPRETDLPVWADNEMSKAFLQFKSFSLAAHNQITNPMIERGAKGDLMIMQTLGLMGAGAVVTEISKLAVADRLDEMDRMNTQDWALAIADRSGAVPMLMMGFNTLDLASGNRLTDTMGAMPVSRYSDRAMLSALGPTAGTLGDSWRFAAGMADGLDGRDVRAGRRLAPFNNLAQINNLANRAEDWLAGDQRQRRRVRRSDSEEGSR